MGATFAYFSLTSSTAGNSETTVTGEVGKQTELPTITLSGTKTLYLNLTDVHMSQAKADTSYYAMDTETEPTTTPNQHEISTVTVANGQTGAVYQCKSTYTVTGSGDLFDVEQLETDDGTLTITGVDSNVTVTGGTITLKDLKDNSNEKTFEVTFSNLSSDNTERKLQAQLVFHNREANQNYLAGKKMSLTIKNTGTFECDTTTAPTASD